MGVNHDMEPGTQKEHDVTSDTNTDMVDELEEQAAPETGGADSLAAEDSSTESDGQRTAEEPEKGLEHEVATMRDRLLRQTAEFQNYRRRVEQERQADVKFGQSLVLQQLLDVYDDLRRSIEAAEDAVQDENVDTESALRKLLDGVELVFKKFSDELQRFGIEPIEAVGAEFNEHEHEAMMAQPAPEGTDPGVVLAEIQKGYRMGDRVLRHSKVVVSG
jgi:molecular chaperone GrpE